MRTVRRILAAASLVGALLAAAGCGGGRAGGAGDGMAHIRDWYSRAAPGHQPPPAWVFCLPQKDDSLYGLGFALQNMAGEEVTRQNAFDNAIYNLARSIKVAVKARKYIQTETTALSLTDQLLVEKEESIDSHVEQIVRDKAGLIEHWKDMSNGVTWVLAAVSVSDIETLKAATRQGQECRIGERPEWLRNPPASKGVLYGIGEARMHWNPTESYKEAERFALVQISEQIKARVTGFDDRQDTGYEDYTYRIVRIATEGDLSGSDIMARWVDFKTGLAYALARMPMISVKNSILAAAKKVEAEEKAKAGEETEERRALSADEIERKADAALEMMDRALDKQFGPPAAPPPPPDEAEAEGEGSEPAGEAETEGEGSEPAGEAETEGAGTEPAGEAEAEGEGTEPVPEEAPAEEPAGDTDGGEG